MNRSATLDFTGGDTKQRFKITDAAIDSSTTPPNVSIARRTIADVDDPGWIYTANVVNVTNGSFDVLVGATMGDGLPGAGEFPNETITLVYTL